MTLEPLHVFQQRAASPDFHAFCPTPILLVFPHPTDEETGFSTLVARGGLRTLGFSVARVSKRPNANVFASMVTIGRAPNNDIVLKAEGVSKFHAYLQERGGVWTLTDAGASFTTEVNGHVLQKRTEHAPLTTGAELRLASVRLVFATAPDARRLLLEDAPRFVAQAAQEPRDGATGSRG